MKLENDKFLSELTKMFQSAETSGNVVVTMKSYDGRTKPEPRKNPKNPPERKRAASAADHHHHHEPIDEHQCLMRAVKGNKKISTVIAHKEINRFQMAYVNLLRGNMTNLKKKGKSKTETRSKQLTS